MPVKKIAFVVAVVGILSIAGVARAQSEVSKGTTASEQKSVFDRIDDFGRSIFGGILPSKTKTKPSAAKNSRPEPRAAVADRSPDDQLPLSRSGSGLASPKRNSNPVASAEPDEDSSDITPENTQMVERRPTPSPTKAASRPLHERMAGFRRSVFDSVDAESQEGPALRSNADVKADVRQVRPQVVQSARPTAKTPEAGEPVPAETPLVAQRPTPTVRVATPLATEPIRKSENPSATAKPAGNDVLFVRKSAILGVETLGPRTITVGRESTYQVQLTNSGEVAADDLVVFVSLPDWAEVARVEGSVGEAKAPEAAQAPGAVQWKVGRLEAKASERLTLKIIPRQSRSFDLAVRWESKPTASQAMIEVQEPKLSLQLEGPRSVLFGKKELFRLKLTNRGNGNAENVVISLTTVGTGDNVPASHRIGLLAAGETRPLDVELTARQAGDLTIRANVQADGAVQAELAEKIVVRRADLKLDVEGAKVQYIGATTAYTIRVRNVGTAAARNASFAILLPAGVKYISGIDGAKFDADTNRLDWSAATLNPGVEQTFSVRCNLTAAGTGRIRAGVAAEDDIGASAEAVVQVEAVANLTMEVKDPAGPVAVGDESIYEVRVRNRGTREAQNVEVIAYFSRGVEPVSAEGAEHRVSPGQVVFQPIAALGPGEELVLKVRAKAETAGNHVFRAETHCKPLNSRLVSEATNLYYSDGPAAARTARNVPAAQPATLPSTAEQP